MLGGRRHHFHLCGASDRVFDEGSGDDGIGTMPNQRLAKVVSLTPMDAGRSHI